MCTFSNVNQNQKMDFKFLKSCLNFTKCCHGLMVNGGLWICSGEVWSSVVPALVIVVLDIEAGKLREADSQSTASIVDVLSIQRLKQMLEHYV